MDKQRWSEIRALFDAAAELPLPERNALLGRERNRDPSLVAEVDALLAADASTQAPWDSLDRAAPDLLGNLAAAEDAGESDRYIGTRLGAWCIRRVIGRGGMGAVFLAERDDGAYRLDAALKMIRGDIPAAEIAARFASERQILAGLDHPNIARLLDGGTDRNTPYLVIEYVDGQPITTHCDAAQLGISQRLRLFQAVCSAVEHAHQRLVVHRDLKPGNILVDTAGHVKLLDFGIAKLLDPGAGQQQTSTGVRLFTPEYAAPEQLRGDVITTAVDVHALGVLLFELLTGARPWNSNAATPLAIERAILDDDPERPSSIVTTRRSAAGEEARRAAARGLDAPQLQRALRGDMDAIVSKALRKDPAERYATVADLREDVERHLERRPVHARRGNRRYRIQRFLTRHALASALATLTLVSLVVGLSFAVWQGREAARERDIARAEVAKSRAVLEFMGGLFKMADPEEARGRTVSAEELLERGAARIRVELKDQPAARTELLAALGNAHAGLGLYEQSLPMLDEAAALARTSGDMDAIIATELIRAETLQALGRFTEVVDALTPLREGAVKLDRTAALRRAEVDLRLAMAQQSLGDHAAAEHSYRDALATRQRLLGSGHRETHNVTFRYVALLTLRDRLVEARALAERAVADIEGSASEQDPLRADAYASLAMVLSNFDEGDADGEGERLRRRALAIFERAYGADHPKTVGARNDLASVLFGQKRYAEALTMFEAVVLARRAKFGPDHPSVATASNNLAFCHLQLGNPGAALAFAEDAYRIRLSKYGPDHANTAMSAQALGTTELELGRFADAQRHLRGAISGFDAALGSDNSTVLGSLSNLTRALIADGTADPGCANARRGFALAKAGEPGESTNQVYQRGLLGACMLRNGDRKRGRELLTVAAQRLPVIVGAQDIAARRLVALQRQLVLEGDDP